MNKSEKDNLKLIEYQVEQIFVEIKAIKQSNDVAHKEVKDDLRLIKESNENAHEEVKKDLRFIKNNLFDPKEGLWSEVKANTVFRKDTTKWRTGIGLGIFSLIGKYIYDTFK